MAGNQAVINTKLTADGSELTRALNQGIAKASDFKGQMKGLGATIGGAFTVAAIANFVRQTTQAADEIADTASALQLTTDELQSFDAAARMTAGGVDGMRMAMKKLVEVQAQAQDGDKNAIDKILRLGLGQRGLTASTGELVKAAADHYKSTGDLAGIYDLFGRQAVLVKDVFDDIASKSLPDFIAAQKEAGMVVESSMISSLEHTNDLLDKYGKKLSNWKMAVVGAAVQGIEQIEALAKGDFRPMEEIRDEAKGPNELEKRLEQLRNLSVNEKVSLRARMEMIASMREQDDTSKRMTKEELDRVKAIEAAWTDDNEKERVKAFDWQMALAESDLSARTQGQRPDAEWFGSALNRVGAIGSVKGSSPEMQLSKDQLAALKKIAEYVAPIKNLALGTFGGGQ